ncbi:MAG TPA: hypothetical protein VHD33_02030, partial [Legionellaceae bacterium]|nr:hypothetical protein [Legionellaceae bacterium]
YRKVELCKENGIKLIVFGWRNYPKDRIKQTIFILDALAEIVQFNRYHLLKEVNENLLDGVFKEWCNNQGLFNGIEHYQNAVKEEILTRGVLTRAEDSSFASRIGNVCNPKGRYFSQEIRDMAISLGYKSIRANKNYANVLVT